VNICLIADNPETTRHPVVGKVLQQLSLAHTVRLLDVHKLTGDEAIAHEEMHPLADIYLLKSHAPQALQVAHSLEQRGASLINSWASSVACRDRLLMAQRMKDARLPWPQTWSFRSLEELLRQQSFLRTVSFPLVIKSRHSHREDLVQEVHSVQQLQALAGKWNQEPLVLQDFAKGDGSDIKLWVIDQQLFAARRRTRLDPSAPKEDFPIPTEKLPSDWRSIALEVGRVFGLRLYGVDLLMTERGPIIVDVNSFPGFRGVVGADSALISLIERLVDGRGEARRDFGEHG
jgi:ribosomal protein S6--L-glutamate ligase